MQVDLIYLYISKSGVFSQSIMRGVSGVGMVSIVSVLGFYCVRLAVDDSDPENLEAFWEVLMVFI